MDVKINSKLLKELRLAKSWSQETLADKAGLSLRTIQRVETTGLASLQTRLAVARTLEVDPAKFDLETHTNNSLKQKLRFLLNINTALTVLFLSIVTTGVLSILAGVRSLAMPEMTDLLFTFAFCISTSLALNGVGGKIIRWIGYANAVLLCTFFVVVFVYSFAPTESLFDRGFIWRFLMPGITGLAIFAGLENVSKSTMQKRV